MKYLKILTLIIAAAPVYSFHSSERNKFLIEITFRDWLNQPFIRYSLNEKSIHVQSSNYDDFSKTKILYKRNLSKQVSDSIYNYLSKLKLDSSKANCDNPVLDGLWIDYNIKVENLKPINIKTHSCVTRTSSNLGKLVQSQILNTKFTYTGIKTANEN